jgi:tripartite-type tricarboxylate transporter receptor subunit TctC
MMLRLGGLRAALAAAAMMVTMSVAAGEAPYPSRPVEVIVPFAAGGGTDLIARLLSDGLSRRLGQTYVAINRPGANTNLGTQMVARAQPDGYSLLIASIGLAANPALYRKLPFNPQADLAPISLIANAPTILVVPPSLPVNSVAEFVAYVKARPGDLNYASYGVGSGPHLAAEMFQATTGTKIVHIPFGGGGPAAIAVLTNNVQMLFSSVLPVLSMIRSGTLKPIAIAANRRLALLPDVPTFVENGIDYKTGTWFGLLAPARTPEPIVAGLHAATVATLQDAGVRDRLVEQGAEIVANSPSEFRAFLKDESDRLSAVVRNANIHID